MNNEDVLKAEYPTDNIEILALRAEIERLRAENDSLIEQFRALRETCYNKDKLVSELVV
jgi:hypothetical protein